MSWTFMSCHLMGFLIPKSRWFKKQCITTMLSEKWVSTVCKDAWLKYIWATWRELPHKTLLFSTFQYSNSHQFRLVQATSASHAVMQYCNIELFPFCQFRFKMENSVYYYDDNLRHLPIFEFNLHRTHLMLCSPCIIVIPIVAKQIMR